jgi:hypothetical protein
MEFNIPSLAQAFPVDVASIGSGSEINIYRMSATALTFTFLEEDGSTVPSLSKESAFHFFCQRAAAFLPDMAIISLLQSPHEWLGFLHRRQSFFSLYFSYSEAGIPFKASSLLWCIRFDLSLSPDLEVSENCSNSYQYYAIRLGNAAVAKRSLVADFDTNFSIAVKRSVKLV